MTSQTAHNTRKKDARLLYIMVFASSRFAASWMASNIDSGKRDELFCARR
jgi:hypothetical protein